MASFVAARFGLFLIARPLNQPESDRGCKSPRIDVHELKQALKLMAEDVTASRSGRNVLFAKMELIRMPTMMKLRRFSRRWPVVIVMESCPPT